MANRELERRLKDAASHVTPDLKAEILAACEKGKVIPMTQAEVKTKKRGFIPLIAAALKHAGANEGEISRYKIELNRDDGRMVYEIEFNVG